MKSFNFPFDRLKKWGVDESSPHYLRGFLQVIWHGSGRPVTSVSGALPTLGVYEQSVSKKRIGYSLALGLGLASLFGSSIATAAAPGGVESGLKLWFKADAGISTTTNSADVSSWTDQSPIPRTADQPDDKSRQPTFHGSKLNFAENSKKQQVRLNLSNLIGLPTGNNDRTMIVVTDNFLNQETSNFLYYGATERNQSTFFGYKSHKLIMGSGSNVYEGTDFYLFRDSSRSRSNNSMFSAVYSSGNKGYFYIDGTPDATSPFTFTTPWNTVTVGAQGYIGGNCGISEVILYDTALNGSVDLTKIESYLAIKYGIGKTGDYLSATGTKLWDATANSAYSNGTLGIGVEAASALNRKESQITTDNGDHTMLTTQISNTSMTEGQFFLIGHNDASLIYSDTSPKIMPRTWKVAETGTVGAVSIRLSPYFLKNMTHLWVDDDGNFTNGGTTSYDMLNTLRIEIDFTDGQYFTFGTEAYTAPEPTAHPAGFGATPGTTSMTLNWKDSVDASGYLVMCSTADSFTAPVDGIVQADDTNCSDGNGVKNVAQGVGTYTWAGLNPGTPYFFRVYPYSNSGANIDYKTDEPVPAVNARTNAGLSPEPSARPADFSTTAGTVSMTLNWKDSVDASGYLIMCNVADRFTAPVDGTAQTDDNDCSDGGVKSIAQGIGTYNWTGLNPGTPYFFRIYSYSNSGAGIDYKTYTKLSTKPSTDLTNFRTTAGTGSFTLNWTDSIDVSGYLIMCSNVADSFTVPIDGTAQTDDTDCSDGGVKSIAQGIGTYTWTGLNPGTPYFFRIYSYSISGTGIDYKIYTKLSTKPSTDLTNFRTTTAGTGSFTLNWTDSIDVSGYLIMCNVADSFTVPVDGTAQIDDTDCSDGGVKNIAQGIGTYTWTGLNPGTPYFFRIYPYSNSGANIDYKTGEPVPATNARINVGVYAEPSTHPTGFGATPGTTSMTLNWKDSEYASYIVMCSTADRFTAPVDGIVQADDTYCSDGIGVKNVYFGIGTYTWTGLNPNTPYFFRIYPYSNGGANIDYKTGEPVPATNARTNADSNGSHTMRNGAHVISLMSGQTMNKINFGNTRTPPTPTIIRGMKWHDINGDGKIDSDEPGLPEVTIFLDLNDNGVLEANEPSQVTNEQGQYVFSNLEAGTYVVREVVPTGYQQTYPPVLR